MSSGRNGYPGVSADSEQCPWCFEFLNGPRKGENPGRKMGLRAQGTDRYYETGKDFTAGERRAPKKGLYSEGGEELSHVGARFAAHPGVDATGRATGGAALLFVCASLPLYFGGEVSGGSRTMRRALVAAVAIVGAAFLVAAIPLAAVPESLRNTSVPGAAIAQAYSGRGLAVTVGLLTAGGTLALVVAEYLALARLLQWLHGVPIRTSYAWIAVPFLALDAISIAFPDRFYDDLLKPSLGDRKSVV